MGPDTMILVILQEGYSKFISVGESLLAHKLQVNTTHAQLSSVRGLIHAVWCFLLLILSLSLKWREECVLSRFSRVRLFETLRTLARQAPLSKGFSRKEYWSGLPCPPLGDLPHPGIELPSLTSPALVGGFFTTCTTWVSPGITDSNFNSFKNHHSITSCGS